MNRNELQTWLCGPDAPILTQAEIATLLGVPADSLRDTTLLRVSTRLDGLRFALAVLRDTFATDDDVRRWLGAPRPELGGSRASDLLLGGRTRPVEDLAVDAWRRASLVLASGTRGVVVGA